MIHRTTTLTFTGPFEDQCQGAAGQLSFQDFQRTDIDQCFELAIEGMEVRWGVIIPEHLDENAIKHADGGHGGYSVSAGGP